MENAGEFFAGFFVSSPQIQKDRTGRGHPVFQDSAHWRLRLSDRGWNVAVADQTLKPPVFRVMAFIAARSR
jgi:hypothetical protein